MREKQLSNNKDNFKPLSNYWEKLGRNFGTLWVWGR